jgi:ribose transport system permease protein
VPDLAHIRKNLSFGNIGIVYVWILMIIIFSIVTPDLFPTVSTFRAILNNYSLAGLAALAVLVPMASGAIDASVGGNISLTSVFCAEMLGSTHLPVVVVVLLTLCVGAAVGLANVFVVVILQIPAIIGTLAIWLIADALSIAVSGNEVLSSAPLSGTFGKVFSQANWGDITIPILFVLILATVIGVLLTQTATGRYTYAVGLNPDVARNAGIRVKLIQGRALVIGGILGAFAGLALTAHIASASPGGGDNYLLPAFAAIFLGATQFRAKRFNATGTILAVFMLGTGQYGLVLAGAPQWTPNVFQGLALIIAMGVSQLSGANPLGISKGKGRRLFPFNRKPSAEIEGKESVVPGSVALQ